MKQLFTILAVLFAAQTARAEVTLPAPVQTAVQNSLAIPGARIVAVSFTEPKTNNCAATSASIARSIEGSGRYAVKLAGNGCSAWAWLQLDVWASVPITTRLVREGERLEPAITMVERQITAGRTPVTISPDTAAARSIPRGQVVQANQLRTVGGGAGATVKVLVRSGAIVIESSGRLVSWGRDRTCAVLPSGKHVEGRLENGRLLVDIP